MAFPADALDVTVEIYYDAAWNDITADVFDRDSPASITITRGRGPEGGVRADTGRASLELNNANGKYSPRNPNSTLYGKIGRNTPLRISYTYNAVTYTRFVGEVTAWPARWDPSESDLWVQVEAWGILRRLEQGASPLKSASERLILLALPAPVAWWPLAVGRLRNTSPPRIPTGGAPMLGVADQAFGNTLPNWSAGDLAPWLAPGVNLDNGGSAQANVPLPPSGWVNTDGWTIDVTFNVGQTRPVAESPTPLIYVTGGTAYPTIDWEIDLQPAGGTGPTVYTDTVHAVFTETTSGSSSSATVLASQASVLFDDNPHHVQLSVDQVGADINWSVYVDGDALADGTVVGKTLQWPSVVYLNSFRNDRFDKYAVGDVVIWATGLAPFVASSALGEAGEIATVRIQRLCDEEGIPVSIVGESQALMGAQRIATLLDLLDDCAAIDRGMLYEQRDAIGVAYRANSSRFGQSAALTLDYSAGQIAPPFEPLPDDRGIVNDVTVYSRDGFGVQVEEATGPLSVQSPPNGVGRYQSSVTVDSYADEQLLHIGSWMKTLGTQDVERYPTVRVNLAANPDLIPDAASADTQDRLVLTDLPPWMPPGDAELIIEGYTETISQFSLDITFNCSPGNVYQQVGVWELMSHELHAAINSSTTSIDIANTDTSQPMLKTSGLGAGYRVTVGGEKMQITAVADSLASFGNTGTASTGSSGSRTPGLPTGSASGNAVFIFASTRNSGTGTVDTPANWTRLPIFPSTANCQVFCRIYDGVWSMPTVTFTAGVALEDTIAQSMRLPGKWHDASKILLGYASCLNASAQNITYPGLSLPVADNCIALWFGWKQDDFSASNTPNSSTQIQLSASTAGNDAGQVWFYANQTTATAYPSAAPTVTGGAAAISRGGVAFLRCDYQTATATRGVAGTTAASHSAGDDVVLSDPMRWGLL